MRPQASFLMRRDGFAMLNLKEMLLDAQIENLVTLAVYENTDAFRAVYLDKLDQIDRQHHARHTESGLHTHTVGRRTAFN